MEEGIPKERSALRGLIWMAVVSLLLFWLPVFGPLIAGFVGGRKAGGLCEAALAALVPAVVLGLLLFLFATAITGMPLIGALAGMGGLVIAVAQAAPLFIGAIIGGLTA